MPSRPRRPAAPFAIALGASLAGHVALAAVWIVERSHPPDDVPPTEVHAAPMTGESFDIAETDEPSEAPAADPSPAIEFPANAVASEPASADGESAPKHPHAPSTTSTNASNPSAAPATAAAPGSFGAVGERGAVEIVPFFQRAFVQVASADPAWSSAAFGSAGTTSVTFTIDAGGHLSGTTVGSGAGAALASSISRTVPLLAHRTFTAAAARSVLQLSAHVTKDAVHDGLHGDVFALGVTSAGSGASGTAWFALPSGRRVDLTIRAK